MSKFQENLLFFWILSSIYVTSTAMTVSRQEIASHSLAMTLLGSVNDSRNPVKLQGIINLNLVFD